MKRDVDVVVVGAGPSALAIAESLALLGQRLMLVAPDPEAAWQKNLCLLEDEATELGLDDVLERRWSATHVVFRGHRVPLGLGYVLLDEWKLRTRVFAAITAQEGEVVAGTVDAAACAPAQGRVVLTDGRTVSARVVVDASGHRPVLGASPEGRLAAQTALGLWVRPSRPHGAPVDQACLMDWRQVECAAHDGAPPSFAYILPWSNEDLFVQETILTARPPVPRAVLNARLQERLASMGCADAHVLGEEWCVIPMGGRPGPARPGVVRFGGAAQLVHPATGYSVGRSFARAVKVAQAIAEEDASSSPTRVAQRAEAALWSQTPASVERLYRMGMETLIAMSPGEVVSFFAAFFALPRSAWRPYFRGDGSLRDTATTMLRVFGTVPPPLRKVLASSALGLR